jgi:hypothetical protein
MLFAAILLALAGAIVASWLSPEQQSTAQIAVMNAKRQDQAAAIQQQYDQARANIQAEALAKMDLEKRQAQQQAEIDRSVAAVEFQKKTDLNRLAAEFKQRLDELEATHQAALAEIQAKIDRARADAARDVILAVGGALLVILVGSGVGNGVTAWARNRGETVRPDPLTGQFPAIVRSDAVYLPSRMTGAYMVIRRPSALEKIIVAIGMAVAMARGRKIERTEAPWVQMPEPSEAQMQVTARDQAHGLLTSATRNGHNSAVADKAVQQVFQANAGTLESRLPTTQRALSLAELDRITSRLEEQE